MGPAQEDFWKKSVPSRLSGAKFRPSNHDRVAYLINHRIIKLLEVSEDLVMRRKVVSKSEQRGGSG